MSHSDLRRHTGESRYPEVFQIPGFRLALPRTMIRLAGMTPELFSELQSQHTSSADKLCLRVAQKDSEAKHAWTVIRIRET